MVRYLFFDTESKKTGMIFCSLQRIPGIWAPFEALLFFLFWVFLK
jgi:hypothetical protein